jgi:large subunit ribosomal protein L29
MPILRVKDIRGMSTEDSSKRLNEFRTELLRLTTMIRAGGTVENPNRIRELKKAIAKILTIEREQQLGLGTAKKQENKKPEKKVEEKKPKKREKEKKK